MSDSSTPATAEKKEKYCPGGQHHRLLSLDTLRGANMLFIMGGAGLFITLAQFWPDSAVWQWIAMQMEHADWHGLRHHDTIFPLFLFLAGASFPFSLARQKEKGHSLFRIHRKVFWRGLLLVLIGVIYGNSVSLDFANLRYASVLGHIGLAWMFAALLTIWFGPKVRMGLFLGILVGYWALLTLIPAPNAPAGADCFSFEGCLPSYIDQLYLPGAFYPRGQHIGDPEGILSLIPAIATALLGVFCGELLRSEKWTGQRKVLFLLGAGILAAAVGGLWGLSFPINKKIWTSTFVLAVGGYSMILLALFYWIIDVLQWRRWTLFFAVIGMNSITIYLAQNIIGFHKASDFFFKNIAALTGTGYVWWNPVFADVITKSGYILVAWLFLYFLYRQKIFLKI